MRAQSFAVPAILTITVLGAAWLTSSTQAQDLPISGLPIRVILNQNPKPQDVASFRAQVTPQNSAVLIPPNSQPRNFLITDVHVTAAHSSQSGLHVGASISVGGAEVLRSFIPAVMESGSTTRLVSGSHTASFGSGIQVPANTELTATIHGNTGNAYVTVSGYYY